MITIRFYNVHDRERWDSYVLNHSDGTFFHLIGWKTVIEKTFGHKSYYLIAESNDDTATLQHDDISIDPINPRNSINASNSKNPNKPIVGVLPLLSVRSFLFSRSLVSLPFAAYGGILADNREVAHQLFDEAKKITRSEGLDYLELRNRDGGIESLPSKDLYVFFRRKMFDDLESNMDAIPRKSRRMIRVGEKAGLTYKFGREELLPEFYEILARSYHRLGSPVFSIKLFKNLLGELREQANILVVKNREGKSIAGVLTFFYKDQVLPYYAGSLFEYRDLAPNDYMYWQLMKCGWERGYKLFDFGRSKVDTGSYDFKRHWGFEPEPLPYQYFLNRINEIPNLSPANPKYQKKIELWRKLPFRVTQIIGPHIVKYIP